MREACVRCLAQQTGAREDATALRCALAAAAAPAPDGAVVLDQVVGRVVEDDLAEVAHHAQVLPRVVHAAGGQRQQRAAAGERVHHVAAQKAG